MKSIFVFLLGLLFVTTPSCTAEPLADTQSELQDVYAIDPPPSEEAGEEEELKLYE